MKEFYPVAKNSEKLLNAINESDERSLYCVDWTDELEIYGDASSQNASFFEALLLPCNVIMTEFG